MPGYDYYGLLASTWDIWRDDTANWSDRFFYLDIIGQYGEPVLDIGCGTGRLLLDYLAEGIDVDGVDSSAQMLDICRADARRRGLRAPALYQQQMERLDLPRSYRTIVGASSVLQLVTEADAAAGALRRILGHLHPGGAFVTPFAFEWRPGDPLDTGWELLFDKPRPADGATVRAWTREWREPPVSCGTPSSGSRWRSTALLSSANITGDPRRGAGTPSSKRPNCSGPLDTAASGCSAASPTSRPASRTGSTACWASGQHHRDGRTAHPRCRGRLRAAGSWNCIGDRWWVPPGSRGWLDRHTPRRPSALSTPASPADSRTSVGIR
jgi:SAM-dependent methyltransferase